MSVPTPSSLIRTKPNIELSPPDAAGLSLGDPTPAPGDISHHLEAVLVVTTGSGSCV